MPLRTGCAAAVAALAIGALPGCGSDEAGALAATGPGAHAQALPRDSAAVLGDGAALAAKVVRTARAYAAGTITRGRARERAEAYQERAGRLADRARGLSRTAAGHREAVRLAEEVVRASRELRSRLYLSGDADAVRDATGRLRRTALATSTALATRLPAGARRLLDDASRVGPPPDRASPRS